MPIVIMLIVKTVIVNQTMRICLTMLKNKFTEIQKSTLDLPING